MKKQWRVFQVSAKTPDKISLKLEGLLTKLETEEWEIHKVNGPYPMAIQEGSKETGILEKTYKNVVMSTFTAFVVARK